MKGLMVRARAKWIEEGKKPIKYFLALEKRNYINKTISKIANDSGVLITNQQEILNEIKYFYQTLYSNKDNDLNDVVIEEIIDKSLVNILDRNMYEKLEGKITYSEALETLKNMKNDKLPGSDGFTAELKIFFLERYMPLLVNVSYESFEKGLLSTTQKLGIIYILPKEDKCREYLKYWRPISLLNVSYKLISVCIANRLKQVLDYIINENQKDFLKGRFIGENTRFVYDIINETKIRQIPGMILLIDFEKAFDSISWSFMFKALKFFNFGPNIIRWVKTCYTVAKLCVIQNGIFSDFFNIGRGCRQGDPISP